MYIELFLIERKAAGDNKGHEGVRDKKEVTMS